MDGGAWQATVHSVAKNLTRWKRLGAHHGLYCLQLDVDEEGIEQLCLLNEWLHAPSHCPRREIRFFCLILQMRKLTLKKVTMLCAGSQEILSKSSAQCHKQFNIQQLCCQEWTSLVAQTVKRLPIMRDTQLRSLGWEDPLEKEMATHSRSLAWKIPRTEEPGRLQSMGSQRVGHD